MIANEAQLKVYRWLVLVLLVALVSAILAAVSYRADAKVCRAKGEVLENREVTAVQGAQDASAGQDLALDLQNQCAQEMQRVRDENTRAERAAFAAGVEEGKRAETFLTALENPANASQCDDILTAKVCPQLMDY